MTFGDNEGNLLKGGEKVVEGKIELDEEIDDEVEDAFALADQEFEKNKGKKIEDEVFSSGILDESNKINDNV